MDYKDSVLLGSRERAEVSEAGGGQLGAVAEVKLLQGGGHEGEVAQTSVSEVEAARHTQPPQRTQAV